MKKIFTFAIALLTALSMSALEKDTITLFEGTLDCPDEWGTSNVISSQVSKLVSNGAIVNGSVFTFYAYRTDGFGEEQYSKIAVINSSWVSVINGGSGDDAREDIELTDSMKYVNHELEVKSFTVTDVTLMSGGILLTGHGWQITKIEVIANHVEIETIEDLPVSKTLWVAEEGADVTVDNWGEAAVSITDPYDLFSFNKYVTRATNLYVRLNENATGGNMRISGEWDDAGWAANALPADGYNHINNMDADYVVKVECNANFVQKAFVEQGGFTIWGSGFFDVLAIGTSKAAVMTPGEVEKGQTAVENVSLKENGVRYNVLGMEVSEDYKGIVIVNGQKMLVR